MFQHKPKLLSINSLEELCKNGLNITPKKRSSVPKSITLNKGVILESKQISPPVDNISIKKEPLVIRKVVQDKTGPVETCTYSGEDILWI